MMKIRLLVLYVLVSAGVFAQNTGKLKKYLKENTLGNVADQRFADKKLTAKGAIEAEQGLLEEEISSFLGVEEFFQGRIADEVRLPGIW